MPSKDKVQSREKKKEQSEEANNKARKKKADLLFGFSDLCLMHA